LAGPGRTHWRLPACKVDCAQCDGQQWAWKLDAKLVVRPVRPKEKGLADLRALENVGAGEKSRTPDLRITNALLYQLSYAGVSRGL